MSKLHYTIDICVVAVAFVLTNSTDVFALRSAAEVNGLYPGGVGSFQAIDREIYNNGVWCITSGKYPDLSWNERFRECVNRDYSADAGRSGTASYANLLWISPRNQPNVNSITVNGGSQTIQLQLNTMVFIGNTLTIRGGNNPVTDCAFGPPTPFINSSNPDDLPGTIGGSCRQPKKTSESYSVSSITAGAFSVSGIASGTISVNRDGNSRYWKGGTKAFNISGNFTKTTTIYVRVTYKNISNYNGEYLCTSGSGNIVVNNSTDFSRCSSKQSSLPVTINVRLTPPSITPTVSISPSIVSVGDTVTDKVSFKNNGQTTVDMIAYRYELVVYDKGGNRVATYSRGMSASSPWHISNVGAGKTAVVSVPWSGDWTDIIRSGERGPNYKTGTVEDLTRSSAGICVNAWRSWITLTPSGTVNTPEDGLVQSCAKVAKSPALTVTGGDVRVGGSFASGGSSVCTLPIDVVNNNNPYGIMMYKDYGTSRSSLGQYAARTPGLITGYGSKGVPYKAVSGWNSLLFGTGGFPGYGADNHGFFLGPLLAPNGDPNFDKNSPSYCLPNTANMYSVNTAPQTITADVNNATLDSSVNYVFNGTGRTLNLSKQAGTTIPANKRVVIKVTQASGASNNKIVIKGPITYQTDGYTSVAELPQFVLVADGKIDVRFDGNAAISLFQFDGIISTKGNVYTCDGIKGDTGDSLTLSTCPTQLVVNGAIIAAGRVLPYRTYGFDRRSDTSRYAEQFNLTADTLLGDYVRTESSGLTVDYQSELPARY